MPRVRMTALGQQRCDLPVEVRGSWYHYLQPRWSSLGLQVRERELWISDIAWYLPRLRPLLEAAVTTGNPVVQYHNGASLGFELPRLV